MEDRGFFLTLQAIRRQLSAMPNELYLSTVSKHLSVLKAAGVVQDERRGAQIWYRLRMKCVTKFFGCVESELQQQAREHCELVHADTP